MSDNTIQAEGLGSFLKNLGKISAKAFKNLATNVIKKSGRALEITSNIATAAATKSPKAALSTLSEVIIFFSYGQRLVSRKVCLILYYLNGSETGKIIPTRTIREKILIQNKD